LNAVVLDSYCITRDLQGKFASTNYLATSPVLYVGGGGNDRAGKSTAFVIGFDCLIYAFDPVNLSPGPLYVLNPIGSGMDTISTDHLAVTSAGTLLFTGWDDGDAEYSVWAVPGVSQISMSPSPIATPSNTPSKSSTPTRSFTSSKSALPASPSYVPAPPAAPAKLSAGAGAAITLAVLAVLGGGAFYFINAAGGLQAFTAKLMGGSTSYGAFGSNIGVSSPSFGSAFNKVSTMSSTSSASATTPIRYQSV
jgi:hypothetical protein